MNVILSMGSLLLLLSACAGSPQPVSSPEPVQKQFSYDQQLGLVVYWGDDHCLAIHNASIQAGSKLTLVWRPDDTDLDHDAPEVREATVVEQLTMPCDGKLGNGDRETTPSFYRLRTGETRTSLFVAVVDPVTPIVLRDRTIDADLDGDGTKESFRTCASSEGVHFQVWTGAPLDGKPRWHWYYYAGYDTEYTCTEREYFGPK